MLTAVMTGLPDIVGGELRLPAAAHLDDALDFLDDHGGFAAANEYGGCVVYVNRYGLIVCEFHRTQLGD